MSSKSGAITFGRGVGGRGQNQDDGNNFAPPAGLGTGQGGGPGGGGPGGLGGAGGGNLSEADIATRQAQFASGEGFDELQDQALVGAVVRLLQTKTGETPERPPNAVVDAVWTAVSEMDVEQIADSWLSE